MKLFLRVVLTFISIPAFLGTIVGILYRYNIVGNDGAWVSIFNWSVEFFLSKGGLIFEILFFAYLALWMFFSGMHKIYKWSIWLIIKCLFGVAVPPTFILAVSLWNKPLQSVIPASIILITEGLVLGWSVYYFFSLGAPGKEKRDVN